jgi:hypothetical protein
MRYNQIMEVYMSAPEKQVTPWQTMWPTADSASCPVFSIRALVAIKSAMHITIIGTDSLCIHHWLLSPPCGPLEFFRWQPTLDHVHLEVAIVL